MWVGLAHENGSGSSFLLSLLRLVKGHSKAQHLLLIG
jgi:hypothetical protein